MNEFRFLGWKVYKDSKEVVKKIYKLTGEWSNNFKFSLGDQINRSALSMPLNIAEGSGKNSDKELNRYFDIAIGSTYEAIACLDIAFELKLLSQIEFDNLSEKCKHIARQLGSFKNKLKH